MKESSSKSTSNILKIGLGIVTGLALALGGYLVYKKYNAKRAPPPAVEKQLQLPEIDNNKLKPIVRQINRELVDNIPLAEQPQMFKKIYRRSIELILEEYNQLVVSQRIRRRKLIHDKVKYIKEIMKEQDQKKQLKEKSLNAILAQINISQDTWSEAILTWMSIGKDNEDDWGDLFDYMEDSLLEEFELVKKKMPIEDVLQTHIRYLKCLDTKRPQFRQIPQDVLSIIVNIMVGDEIYFNHGFEKEDIAAAMADLNQQDRKRLEKYFEEIDELSNKMFEDDAKDNGQE